MFLRILEEEEDKASSYSDRELSSLMRWSQDSGAMWLHMALSWGFGGPELFPFVHLQRHIGREEWDRREAVFADAKEMSAFVERKVRERGDYSEDEAFPRFWFSIISVFWTGRLVKKNFWKS